MGLFDASPERKDLFSLQVDDTAKAYLLDTARWTRFLAIVGFVMLTLLVIFGIFGTLYLKDIMAAQGKPISAGVIMSVNIVFSGLYCFPTWYLFQFSRKIKASMQVQDAVQFNDALKYLRNCFRFMGIMVLILLAIYALAAIVLLISYGMK